MRDLTVYDEAGLAEMSKADQEVARIKPFMELLVESLEDKEGIAKVHEARMEVKALRVSVEKSRKELKAGSLEFGRRVDAEAKRITSMIEPIETHLIEQESIVKKEKERLAKIEQEKKEAEIRSKLEKLAAFGVMRLASDIETYSIAEFEWMLLDAEKKYKAKKEAEEAERKKQAEESERLRIERERQEAEAARLKAERKEQEAEIRKLQEEIRIAREKAEAEARKAAEELAAQKREIEAEKRRIEKEEFERQAKERAEIEAMERLEREAKEKAKLEARQKAEEEARIERERQEAEEAAIQAEARKTDQQKLDDMSSTIDAFTDRLTLPILKTKAAELAVKNALFMLRGAASGLRMKKEESPSSGNGIF